MVVIILQQISVSSQHVVHLRFTHVTCQFYPNKAEGGKQPQKKKKKKKKTPVYFFREKREKIPNCLAVACYMVAKSPL